VFTLIIMSGTCAEPCTVKECFVPSSTGRYPIVTGFVPM
jgi:hypothetical protein